MRVAGVEAALVPSTLVAVTLTEYVPVPNDVITHAIDEVVHVPVGVPVAVAV